MNRVQQRDAWPFLDELTDDYGQVVRLTGPLGVLAACDRLLAQSLMRHVATHTVDI